jgi:hypothetical protein
VNIYAASYTIEDVIITVSADGDHLVAVTPEGTLALYPASASDFIIFEQDLLLKFEFDGSGKVIRARDSSGRPIERIEPR